MDSCTIGTVSFIRTLCENSIGYISMGKTFHNWYGFPVCPSVCLSVYLHVSVLRNALKCSCSYLLYHVVLYFFEWSNGCKVCRSLQVCLKKLSTAGKHSVRLSSRPSSCTVQLIRSALRMIYSYIITFILHRSHHNILSLTNSRI